MEQSRSPKNVVWVVVRWVMIIYTGSVRFTRQTISSARVIVTGIIIVSYYLNINFGVVMAILSDHKFQKLPENSWNGKCGHPSILGVHKRLHYAVAPEMVHTKKVVRA